MDNQQESDLSYNSYSIFKQDKKVEATAAFDDKPIYPNQSKDQNYFKSQSEGKDVLFDFFSEIKLTKFPKFVEEFIEQSDIEPQCEISMEKQKISENLKQQPDPVFKNIFKESRFDKKNGNTARFLVFLAIKYFEEHQEKFSTQMSQSLLQTCSQFQTWHLKRKKNVYGMEHLHKLFGDHYEKIKGRARKAREVFSIILQQDALQAIKNPRSQIQDKVHYLRVAKIYNLRCRSNQLSLRNQTR